MRCETFDMEEIIYQQRWEILFRNRCLCGVVVLTVLYGTETLGGLR